MAETMELTKEIQAAKVLRDQIKDLADGDADFIRDTIEGETSLFELIGSVAASAMTDDTLAASLKVMIDGLKARRERIEARAEVKRALIASAMEIAQIGKLEAPACTITVKNVAPTAMIVEESDIPARFYEAQPPKLDKRGLTEALRARAAAFADAAEIEDQEARAVAARNAHAEHPPIPGAFLSNGGKTIQLRVK